VSLASLFVVDVGLAPDEKTLAQLEEPDGRLRRHPPLEHGVPSLLDDKDNVLLAQPTAIPGSPLLWPPFQLHAVENLAKERGDDKFRESCATV
jgi:hypothetical protein